MHKSFILHGNPFFQCQCFYISYDFFPEPVRFGEMQSIVTAQEGETVTLRCIAYGNPQPEIVWLRGGTEVYFDGVRIIQEADDSLVIRDVQQADQGDYVCEASNGIGAVEQRIIVINVLGEILSPNRWSTSE